jgi:hypothetical protein
MDGELTGAAGENEAREQLKKKFLRGVPKGRFLLHTVIGGEIASEAASFADFGKEQLSHL